MKSLLIFLIGLLLPTSKPCLSAWTAKLSADLIPCLQSLPNLEPEIKFANKFIRSSQLSDLIYLMDNAKPFLPHLPTFLGQDKPVTYLILLQNNHEMRANGGFFGSYAKINLSDCQLSIVNCSLISFQDIYVPDGALPGHVDPPTPIQEAFKQGWFRLRDADWEPDFPTSAKTIRWFFEKGGEVNPDFLITLNLATIEKIVGLVGEVYVPEYDLKLDSDTLYALLQNKAEVGFFPGSTQKKDVLTAAGRALVKKLSALSPNKYLSIAKILTEELNHGNLLLNAKDDSLQQTILAKDWAGQLSIVNCPFSTCLADTVLLVEANMGANKANCCVDRKTTHTISLGETEINHLANVTFTNNSVRENPLPPRFYGGNYISYLRFYIPENARNVRLTAQPTLPKTLTQYPRPYDGMNRTTFDQKFAYGFREIGFWHTTAAGTKSAVQLSYELPLDGNPNNYQLTLLKQHGLEKSPQEINLFDKTSATDLTTNYTINASLD